MSSRRSSKRASPKKIDSSPNLKSLDEAHNLTTKNNSNHDKTSISPSKRQKPALKLRLKVSKSQEEESSQDRDPEQELSLQLKVPKILLNFSKSPPASSAETVEEVKPKHRGRPKKDKTAVKEAALKASQPNVEETEARKVRRRAIQEKIRKSLSASEDKITVEAGTDGDNKNSSSSESSSETSSVLGKKRGRRPKQRFNEGSSMSMSRSSSNEFIDIIGRPSSSALTSFSSSLSSISRQAAVNAAVPNTTFNPHESEFIQQIKTFLSIASQHDSFLLTSCQNPDEVSPFQSFEDAVERLLPFHLGISAGQFSHEELTQNNTNMALPAVQIQSDPLETLDRLVEKYRSLTQQTKRVPTELLLLEQRLCLEEEKFLLVKLKNEYSSKFLNRS